MPSESANSLLRQLRRGAGLSQEQLAERCDLSVRAISKLESGRVVRPHRRTVDALAAALGLDEGTRARLDAHLRVIDPGPLRPMSEATPSSSLVPAQLPHSAVSVAGREAEVAAVARALAGRSHGPILLYGLSGIGKSALAVDCGRRATGQFSDGTLFAELTRPDDSARDPMDVIAELLRALGVVDHAIPTGAAGRTGLWRTVTSSRRLLLILDDAVDEDQVRPLLVGGHCRTIITSRNPLGGLDADVRLLLHPLDDHAALRVLQDATGRPAGELTELVAAGAGVPLALRLIGARLALAPSLPASDLARRLIDERERLDELSVGDRNVRDAIASSMRLLTGPARHCLTRLARLELPNFGAWVVQALTATSTAGAARILEELVSLGLVDVATEEHEHPRYRLHDLVRLHASQDGAPIADAELTTMCAWAVHLIADNQPGNLARPTPHVLWPMRPRELPSPLSREVVGANPADWFDLEWSALCSLAHGYARTGASDLAVGLLGALRMPMTRSGRLLPLRTLAQHCAQASAGLTQACARLVVAAVDAELGRFADAARDLTEIMSELAAADTCTLAGAWHELGWVSARIDDLSTAAHAYAQALELHSQIGNRYGELVTHAGLAELNVQALRAGDLARAAEAHGHANEALLMVSSMNDYRTEANVLMSLSTMPELGALWQTAVAALPASLDAAQTHHDDPLVMRCSIALAAARRIAGDIAGSRRAAEDAVALASSLERPADLAAALTELGNASAAEGNDAPARSSWTSALTLRDGLGHLADAHSLRTKLVLPEA